MTRMFVIFGCVLAFGLATPMGFEAAAAKKRGHKMCASSAMDGKQTKWRCKASQKCCFDWMANKGACVGANDICL